ncbi:MFS transporter [Glaciihabitans tibetensis]|uniref:MFS transporter n=1 Tax=Glaciihabitans tibetensis TaxID=1266600 RepID=A0A2T0VD53_9MICO|nr:MFS transporter [Glaciihabitans tibetensis]PRY68074.1 MFS transporter [Glaciihabitans tibetensis]
MSVEASTTDGAEKAAPAVSRRWIVAYVLAMVGVAAGWFGPIQILLPAQSARFAGDGGKELALAMVTAYGALVALVANPLWGVVSDRVPSRWGRRRPVFLAGTAVGVVGLVVLGVATDVAWMTVGWVIVQLGLSGPLAALAAMIADGVPERQRGLVGSLFGVAQTLGVVAGTAVAVLAGEGSIGYFALAIAVPALGVALMLQAEAPTPPRPPGALAAGFARGLRPSRDFVWAWIVRLLLNLVNALVILYLYYFLADGVGVDEPGTWVLILTLVNVLVAATVASVGGVLSDRWQRRRAFVVVGAVVLAGGSIVMALVPNTTAVLVATVLIGVGWGAYVSVDMAIMTQVLPAEGTRATMLGVANVASALPQVLAPVLAAPVVTMLGGYPSLYGAVAVIALLALVALSRVRSIT